MDIQYNNFIGIYDNVYPEGYCEHLISEFDRLEASGAGSNRVMSENALRHRKHDLQINLSLKGHATVPFQDCPIVDMFFDGLQKCYEEYTGMYSVLVDSGKIRANTMKMQRTEPGGGYHVWHGEQGSGDHSNRVLVYMLYLNTLPDSSAGETEFLYLRERYKPISNRMIIWPAAYTHAHRGNTVLGDTSKYIVTGWFYYD